MQQRLIKIYPPLYMLMMAGLMGYLHQYLPLYHFQSDLSHQLALFFIGFGLLLDLSSLFLFIWKKTTPHPFREQKTEQLVITGFYYISRNPMYLGLLFLLIGFGLYLGSISGFILMPIFIGLINSQQIIYEERILTEKFGQVYITYQQRVRRWL